MEVMTLDLVNVLAQTVTIAREAGALLKNYAANPPQADQKATSIDYVTQADRDSEALIVSRISAVFPDHHIVGEEGGSYENGTKSPYRWYIDPLDGTTNFAHGIPHFSVSIALTAASDGLPIVAVVDDPMRDECFAAARGFGVTLNDRPIKVSSIATLATSVLASGFPYDKWNEAENNAEQWGNFVPRTSGERRFGSASLDMAYVAAGRFDGYWEQKVNFWDIMAGVLLVTEAGGTVTDYEGTSDWLTAPRIRMVASNRLIHEAMLSVLRQGKDAPRPQR